MKYDAKIEEGRLIFTRKSGEKKGLYVGRATPEATADVVLGSLYDFHQCDDEFGPEDEIEVDGKWLFRVYEKIHILPANDETKFAVLGVSAEKPFRVAYSGMDGKTSTSFATIEEAAAYVKDRWMGIDYVDSSAGFHNDYGRFMLFGFQLKDVGEFSGSRQAGDRDFKFTK